MKKRYDIVLNTLTAPLLAIALSLGAFSHTPKAHASTHAEHNSKQKMEQIDAVTHHTRIPA